MRYILFRERVGDMPKLDQNRKTIILDYINEYYNRNSRKPAVRDICAGTGIPATSVQRYLVALKESGELDYSGRRSIGTDRMKKERNHYAMPVLGSVSCGPGDYEEENIIEYIRMPEAVVGKGEFFALIAKGHSMVDAGIHEGDYVIVRKQNTARVGDLVVALYDGGLNNLKKLCCDERQGYYLYSCNADQETYPPIYVDQLQVQGVAVSVVHSLVQE